MLRRAQQHLSLEPKATVYHRMHVVIGQQVVFVQLAAKAAPLQRVMHAAGERFVRVAVRDEHE